MECDKYYEEFCKSKLIIGVGEFGCNVVAQMQIARTNWNSKNSKGFYEMSYFKPSCLTVSSMNDFIQEDVVELINDNDIDMVFVVCGIDGVTETAVAPVIAETSKKLGILTIGIVTNTLPFESQICMEQVMSRIKKLRENADAMIVIPDEKLKDNKFDSGVQLIREVDEVCVQTVESIIEMVNLSNPLKGDIEMLSERLKSQGVASIARVGIGICNSDEEIIDIAKAIVFGPLSDVNLKKASYVLIHVTGGFHVGMFPEIDVLDYIENLAGVEIDEYIIARTVECAISDNHEAAKITIIIGQQC